MHRLRQVLSLVWYVAILHSIYGVFRGQSFTAITVNPVDVDDVVLLFSWMLYSSLVVGSFFSSLKGIGNGTILTVTALVRLLLLIVRVRSLLSSTFVPLSEVLDNPFAVMNADVFYFFIYGGSNNDDNMITSTCFCLAVQLCILFCFELHYIVHLLLHGPSHTEKSSVPSYETAMPLSRVTFSWIGPLFDAAARGQFTLPSQRSTSLSSPQETQSASMERHFFSRLSGLPAMPSALRSYHNMLVPGCQAWSALDIPGTGVPRKLYRLLRTLSRIDGGKEFLWICIPLKIAQDLLSIASHNSINSVMTFLDTSSELNTISQILAAGFYVCVINLSIRLAQTLLFQLYLAHLYTSSLKVSTALKTLIMKSVLDTPLASSVKKMQNGTSHEKNTRDSPSSNEALSLLTIDADRCGECMIFLHNTWSHPIVVLLALLNMYRSIGLLPTVVTFVSLLCAIPLNKKSSLIVKYAKKNAKDVVTRVSDLMVALPVMRTVHAMSLQSAFLDRIRHWREEESRSGRSIIRAESEAAVLTEMVMILIYILCYGSYFLLGNNPSMKVSALLPAAASLSVLRFPIWASPNLITQVVNGYDAASRIEQFLSRHPLRSLDEKGETAESLHHTEKEDGGGHGRTVCPGTIECKGIDFWWMVHPSKGGEKPVLSDVDFRIHPGEFVVLKGATGAGKTALLLSLLGELYAQPHPRSSGESTVTHEMPPSIESQLWCHGTVVYCAETPWIGDGTIREVITMRSLEVGPKGKRMTAWKSTEEEGWYSTVIRACELDVDIKALPHGDLSEVGSAGSALSGGQKARVALARALFYRMGESDIFLLDNVLSALDFDLQQRIVHRVFYQLIIGRGKTLVLASSVFPPQLTCSRLFTVKSGGAVTEESEGGNGESSPVVSRSLDIEHITTPSSGSPISLSNPYDGISQEDSQEDVTSLGTSTVASPLPHLLPNPRDLKALLWVHYGPRTAIMVLVVFIVRQVLYTITENWMGIWFRVQSGGACSSSESFQWWAKLFQDFGGCTAVYTFLVTFSVMGFISCAMSFWRSNVFFLSFRNAADNLQMAAVQRIFQAPPSYFDEGSASDHVLQVLTKDQSVVDRLVPESVKLIITALFQVGAVVAVNMVQYPLYIMVVPVLIPLFYYLNLNFLRLSKQLRVLESYAQEKSLKSLKNAVSGAITLRAFGSNAKNQVIQELCSALDNASAISHVALTNDRWVALRLEFLSLFMLAAFQILIVLSILTNYVKTGKNLEGSYKGSSALAGLGALALMNSTQQLGQLCRRLGMLQSQFVSVERLTALERETPNTVTRSDTDTVPEETTLNLGSEVVLSVRQLNCRYQDHLPTVLASLCLDVRRGECVGVLGRSGNGKSSLFNALLRVMDIVNGTVWVSPRGGGGIVSTASLSLSDLRRKYLHLVPQEPLIVEGTVRENLELGSSGFAGEELLKVLHTVGVVDSLVQSSSMGASDVLDLKLTGGGKNISAGQRQLICLARALLYKPSVLLLDEVTSRIDEDAENALVTAIQNELREGCAVVLISHRRETVEALCDRAVIIRSGSVDRELPKSQILQAFEETS